MSLSVPRPPAEGLGVIQSALTDLVGYPNTVTRVIGPCDPEHLKLAMPHQVYFTSLSDAANERVLSRAVLTGWRYILHDGERALAAIEIGYGAQGEELEFSHVNDGPFVQATVEGVRLAEERLRDTHTNYELRLLNLPSLYVVSLWLYAEHSLLLPLPPTNRMLIANKFYEEDEFAQVIREAALERLTFSDTEEQIENSARDEDEGDWA
jgi:hypothetical protein